MNIFCHILTTLPLDRLVKEGASGWIGVPGIFGGLVKQNILENIFHIRKISNPNEFLLFVLNFFDISKVLNTKMIGKSDSM